MLLCIGGVFSESIFPQVIDQIECSGINQQAGSPNTILLGEGLTSTV
jgi:hypothetical protein